MRVVLARDNYSGPEIFTFTATMDHLFEHDGLMDTLWSSHTEFLHVRYTSFRCLSDHCHGGLRVRLYSLLYLYCLLTVCSQEQVIFIRSRCEGFKPLLLVTNAIDSPQ